MNLVVLHLPALQQLNCAACGHVWPIPTPQKFYPPFSFCVVVLSNCKWPHQLWADDERYRTHGGTVVSLSHDHPPQFSWQRVLQPYLPSFYYCFR